MKMGKYQWDVKRSVTIASFFYFFYNGGKSSLLPFITLYYQSLGISATQTGLIGASKYLVCFFAAPIWVILSQRLQKTKVILGIGLVMSIVCNISITLVPSATMGGLLCDQNFFESNSTNTSHIPFDMEQSSIKKIEDSSSSFPVTLTNAGASSALFTTMPMPSTTVTTFYQTTMSNYEIMAKQLFLRVKAANPTQPSDIILMVSEFNETASFPRWKQHIIVKQLIDMLDKESDNDDSGDEPTNKPEVQNTATLAEETTTHKLGKNVVKVVRKLMGKLLPIFKEEKSLVPNLTVSAFVEESEFSSSLSSASKKFLKYSLKKAVMKDSHRHVRDQLSAQSVGHITNSSANLSIIANNEEEHLQMFLNVISRKLGTNLFTFVLLLIIVIGGEIFSSSIEMVGDGAIHEFLDQLDSLNRYGRHRMAALLGGVIFGIGVPLIVYLMPCFIIGSISRFHIHFYAFAFITGLACFFVPFFPVYTSCNKTGRRSTSIKSYPTCSVWKCRKIFLTITIMIFGIVHAALQSFMFWQIKKLPEASELVFGLVVSVQAFSAIVATIFGHRIVSIVKSSMMVPLVLYCLAVQLVTYSYITNAWFIIPLQFLNIFGPSFLWVLVKHQTNLHHLHPSSRSSQQHALFTSYMRTYQGVAFAIGAVLAGVAYDISGGTLTPFLRISSVVVAVWGCIFLLYQCCCTTPASYSKLREGSDEEELFFWEKSRGAGSSNYDARKSKKGRKEERRTSSCSDEEDWLVMKKQHRSF